MVADCRGIVAVGSALCLMIGQAVAQHDARSSEARNAPSVPDIWITGVNLVAPPGLPVIGKWMLTCEGIPSHWLGEIYEGKSLREPINLILIDAEAGSAEDAKQRLIAASTAAGYPVRMGHSVGYQGYIGDRLHPQLPTGRDDAFSNEFFELSNNHGRIFGPHRMGTVYVFIGAFSRERMDPFRWPEHQYGSFKRARDDFAQKLNVHSRFKHRGTVNLENAIVGDRHVTTGDHDGMAILLTHQ